MEASSVTGPAKNLLAFSRRARIPEPDLPGVEVSIATFQRGPQGAPNSFVRAMREAGVSVETIAERFRFDCGVFSQLHSIVARRSPDIIQSHNIKSHLLVRLTGIWRAKPWVAFHHGYTDRDALDRFYRQFDRFSLRAARRIVTVCRPFAAEIERYGIQADRIWIQHNSVAPFEPPSPESVSETRARFHLPANAQVVLVVGRLSREKGQADLVEAAALLRRQGVSEPFRIVLVGDGPERMAIESRAAALGVGDLVVLCGHQTAVSAFYSLASVVAIPSHSEGSPNVLLEAMAAGAPVVATSVGGVPEIATDQGNALLVGPRDPDALARALNRLLQDRDFACRLAARAREEVLANFTPEAHRQSLVRFYQSVIEGWEASPE